MQTAERTERKKAPRSRAAAWLHVCRTCNLPRDGRFDIVSRWLVVSRACVQPMTLTSAAIAGLLAASTKAFNLWFFGLALVGLVLAHAANNMINDLFDLDAGLDTATYPRALYAPHPVVSGIVSRGELLRAILIVNALDAAILLGLALARGWPVLAFALGGLFISVFYVAPPLRLKAHGLGEPGVFLVWGPLMVGGTYYAATGRITADVLLASIPYALLVTTVLLGKHIDKAPWDGQQQIRTLPVILGDHASRRLTVALMLTFYVALAALVVSGVLPLFALLAGGGLAVLVRVLNTYARPRPDEPPSGYRLWPLWFGPAAFLHARRAGALLVVGLVLGSVWPFRF